MTTCQCTTHHPEEDRASAQKWRVLSRQNERQRKHHYRALLRIDQIIDTLDRWEHEDDLLDALDAIESIINNSLRRNNA